MSILAKWIQCIIWKAVVVVILPLFFPVSRSQWVCWHPVCHLELHLSPEPTLSQPAGAIAGHHSAWMVPKAEPSGVKFCLSILYREQTEMLFEEWRKSVWWLKQGTVLERKWIINSKGIKPPFSPHVAALLYFTQPQYLVCEHGKRASSMQKSLGNWCLQVFSSE